MENKDHVVGNIFCIVCQENMTFSDRHSSSTVAVFYCTNMKCNMNNFMMTDKEVGINPCIIEKE